MFKSLITPLYLSLIVIVSIVISKYLNNSGLYLLVVLLTCIFYYKYLKKNNMNYNFEETLINLSKFIIISVGFGCIIAKILGFFSPDFA